jgi:hypothetical protein
MGVRLIREIIADAPEGLPPLCRLVLLVLAESARDSTRRGFPGMPELCRRTGLAESTVSAVLRELAEWNIEVRVRIGTDRSGRPVYAAKGHRTTYQIPPIADAKAPERPRVPRAIPKRKAIGTEGLSDAKGPTDRTQRPYETAPKALRTEGPSRQSPTGTHPVNPVKNPGGNAQSSTHYARPDGAEPSPRCDDHIDEPTDAPCRACGAARKAHEAWDRARILADAEARSAAAKARAVALAEEIAACRACDHRGRLPGDVLCSHDPHAGDRRARGAAAARAALRVVRPA